MRFYTVFTLTALIFLASCNRCKDKECLNGGVCDNGTCLCVPGYEGELCEIGGCSGVYECENDMPCINSKCVCGDWYDGDRCEELFISRFYGTFRGTEDRFPIKYDNAYTVMPLEDDDQKMIAEDSAGVKLMIIMRDRRNFDVLNHDGSTRREGSGMFVSEDEIILSYTKYDSWGYFDFSTSFKGSK